MIEQLAPGAVLTVTEPALPRLTGDRTDVTRTVVAAGVLSAAAGGVVCGTTSAACPGDEEAPSGAVPPQAKTTRGTTTNAKLTLPTRSAR